MRAFRRPTLVPVAVASQEEVSRLEAELAAARTGEVGQLQAHVFQLHQYGEEAARRLHESEQARREADNMHRLKLQLLVDMWAASLVSARTTCTDLGLVGPLTLVHHPGIGIRALWWHTARIVVGTIPAPGSPGPNR